ncbi:MAG: response regulator transcription factor [Chitinophagaceae bacterium]|nr:response regulator transcription factor [Chitinophagaceae bacterium]
MIRALIIDDEPHCVQRLQSLLNDNAGEMVRVEAHAPSVEEGLIAIRANSPDLVFLDVHLGDKTAFNLLEQLESKNFDIIFTTAYDQYAVRAFRFSALDYLLKPVDADDLKEALQKVAVKREKNETAARLDALMHNLKDIKGTNKRLCVPVMNGFTFLQMSDIVRCQSNINYTTFFLKSGQTLVVPRTLKEFEAMLSDYNFFRVHNSHLVNMACIKSYNKGKGGYITLMDNSVIDVSVRRKDEFLKKLMG